MDNSICLLCHHPAQDGVKEVLVSSRASMSSRQLSEVLFSTLGLDFSLTTASWVCNPCSKLLDMVDRLEVQLKLKKSEVHQLHQNTGTQATTCLNLEMRNISEVHTQAEIELPGRGLEVEEQIERVGRAPVNLTAEVLVNTTHTSQIDLLEPPKKKDKGLLTSSDLKCQICQKTFEKRRYLMDHLRRVHNSAIHRCQGCKARFKYREEMLAHQKNCTTYEKVIEAAVIKKEEEESAIKECKLLTKRKKNNHCGDCDAFFLTKALLERHKVSQHQGIGVGGDDDGIDKEDIVRCGLCGISVNNQYALSIHQSSVHAVERPWVCHTCGKNFVRHLELENHRRVHSGEKPFQCEVCGARFNQKQNLRTHVRHLHLGERRYNCHLCDKKFRRKRLLDCHINSKHNHEKPYRCKICSAAFVYPEHVRKHELTHSSDWEKVKCDECGKGFRGKSSLENHMSVHRPPTSYQCLACPAYFTSRDLLSNHLTTSGHPKGVLTGKENSGEVEVGEETLTLTFMEEDRGKVYEDVVFYLADQQSLLSNMEDRVDQVIVRGQQEEEVQSAILSIVETKS